MEEYLKEWRETVKTQKVRTQQLRTESNELKATAQVPGFRSSEFRKSNNAPASLLLNPEP
jgi:hypothetical protein